MVLIFGVILIGFEFWGMFNELLFYFWKWFWGSWSMMRVLVMDKENWKRYIMLDYIIGLDLLGIKLRVV